MRALAVAFFLVFFLSPVFGGSRWTVQTGDFQSHGGNLVKIDEKALVLRDKEAEQSIAIADFLSAEQLGVTPKRSGRWLAVLSNGDRIAGAPAGTSGETLSWASISLGEINIPLRQIRRIVAARTESSEPASRTDDAVFLANGDSAAGVISTISAAAVTIDSGSGPIEIPLDSVTSVQFATVHSVVAPTGQTFRLGLVDGSQITASKLIASDSNVSFVASDGKLRSLDLASLATVEQINGPVTWLSSLAPAENVHTPYFDVSFPTRFDRSVSGGPIRFRDHTFARGIGVHSASRLVWNLTGEHRSFRTQYAIDGDRPMADVTVRIKADDRVLHEAKNSRAGKLADPIVLDISGAKQLTLEVDFGEGYDVQDHFNWIESALLKNMPVNLP